jgi:hypothetical protein
MENKLSPGHVCCGVLFRAVQDMNSDTDQQLFEQYKALMEGAFSRVQQQGTTDGPLVTLQELAKNLQGQQADAANEEVHTVLTCHVVVVKVLAMLHMVMHPMKSAAHRLHRQWSAIDLSVHLSVTVHTHVITSAVL